MVKTYTDVRNQLACFLREILGIMNQCKFLWTGAALIGIHVTRLFMSMLLDHKVPPRKLLQVLPNVYKNLQQYPHSLCQINCGIPVMKPYFLNPFRKETTLYILDVSKYLLEYINNCNKELMDLYLNDICAHLASVLKNNEVTSIGLAMTTTAANW